LMKLVTKSPKQAKMKKAEQILKRRLKFHPDQ
jgi:hypothetical protein